MQIDPDVALSQFTHYKIGGPARFFGRARTAHDLTNLIVWAKEQEMPFFILGAGSNVLISDQGFEGLAIRLELTNLLVEGEKISAGAGVPMAQLVARAVAAGCAGLEWGVGIPGSVGGSIRGNAGCFGGEVKDVLTGVFIYDAESGRERWLKNAECDFGYRMSIFKKHPYWIILEGVFQGHSGDPKKSQEIVRQYAIKRAESQAIGTQSAGCIFKNVEWGRKDIRDKKDALLFRFPGLAQFAVQPNIPAAFLIDETGMKGEHIGTVEVSPKHANYFVNLGGATAENVVTLIGIVKDRVRRHFGIQLEEEIQYVGF